jgi:hypothetical protein
MGFPELVNHESIHYANQNLSLATRSRTSLKALCESDTSMGPDLAHVGETCFVTLGQKRSTRFAARMGATHVLTLNQRLCLPAG